jgi:bacterioferritin (cytochrome b1)
VSILKYIKVCADLMDKVDQADMPKLSVDMVADALQELLKKEYLQRDYYESYDYLFLGVSAIAIQEHLREHLEQEMDHIRVLQRYLTGFKKIPTLERLPVSQLTNLNVESILRADLELEKDAISSYSSFIKMLEGSEEFTALRVDMENILSQESEHVHDLDRWLTNYGEINK